MILFYNNIGGIGRAGIMIESLVYSCSLQLPSCSIKNCFINITIENMINDTVKFERTGQCLCQGCPN